MVRRASIRSGGIALLVSIALTGACKKGTNVEKLSRLYDAYNCHAGAQRGTDTGALIVKDKDYSHATVLQVRQHGYKVVNWCKR